MAINYSSLTAYIDGLNQDGSLSNSDYNSIINFILANGELDSEPRDLIQVRRGDFANLPILGQGELAFTLDTNELFVGGLNGNVSVKGGVGIYFVDYPKPPLLAPIGDGVTDDTIKLQAIISSFTTPTLLVFGAKHYKITSALTLNYNCRVVGNGVGSTFIDAWNCDGFVINPEFGTTIKDLTIQSLNGFGEYDPKVHNGINSNGTNVAPNAVNKNLFENLYIRGFNNAIRLAFTWDTIIDKVETLKCNKGVLVEGQSVNNVITNSRLVVDNIINTASVETVSLSGLTGEGLMISNTLMASGYFGIKSNTFLSIGISNCIIDLITGNAINLTSAKNFKISNSWVYSTGTAIKFNDLGAYEEQSAKILGNTIESTNGEPSIKVGGVNGDIKIIGNDLIAQNDVVYLEVNTRECVIIGNSINSVNNYSFPIFVGGFSHNVANNSGDSQTQINSTGDRNNIKGNNGNKVEIELSTAPLSGTWKRGDIVYSSTPTAGGYIGFVCVETGTPGTWKGFGLIQA